MGAASSSARSLAQTFGAEQETKRGPTLGSMLLHGAEGTTSRVALVAPLRVQLYDAYTAEAVAIEADPATCIQSHAPFTACSTTQSHLAIGCQDGSVLVFAVADSTIAGPLYELRVEGEQPEGAEDAEAPAASRASSCLVMSITALCIGADSELYAGACGRCRLWDLRCGELRREFHLPAADGRPVTPGTLCPVNGVAGTGEEEAQLWIGLETGRIAVFDVRSGVLVRSFPCTGTEAIVSLAFVPSTAFVFALSAHRRVSVWSAASYGLLQKYPAELITCGSDLSAMLAIDVPSTQVASSSSAGAAVTPTSASGQMALLLLAGIDGSLCVRRVSRRQDGKLNCVLLCYLSLAAGDRDLGCPITSIDYHADTDTVLLGDASCTVSLVSPLRDQLGHTPGEIPRHGDASTPMSSVVSAGTAEGRV